MSTAIERQRKYRAAHLERVRLSAKASARKSYRNNPDKYQKLAREWYMTHKKQTAEYGRKRRLREFYNMTVEDFNKMLEVQGGVCAICKGPPRGRFNTYNVDHDHKTGRVRGLLCLFCNTAIGNAHDSIEILSKMITYINGGVS